jgi:DNA polymerase III delta subunit
VIYFIHGPDRLLARQAAATIAAEHDPAAENTSWLDGRETSIERVVAAVGSAGFFGAGRVVVVSDLFGRAPREAAAADDDTPAADRSDANTRRLDDLLAAVPAENVLILIEPAMTAPPAVLKSAASGVKVIAGEAPRGAALLRWVEETAQERGSRIDRRAAQILVQSLYPQSWERKPANLRYDRPPDIATLTAEIEKLSLAAYPGEITTEHIQALTPGTPDDRLFRFMDAAVRGNMRQALPELDKLLASGDEPAMILAQVLGQIEIAAVAEFAGSRDAATVARDLGTISPGRISAVMASSPRSRRDATIPAVATAAATDRRLKTGKTRQPVAALQNLVMELAGTRGTH